MSKSVDSFLLVCDAVIVTVIGLLAKSIIPSDPGLTRHVTFPI